eukprot:43909-Eustigmatos_ZCMA.PRE.1
MDPAATVRRGLARACRGYNRLAVMSQLRSQPDRFGHRLFVNRRTQRSKIHADRNKDAEKQHK